MIAEDQPVMGKVSEWLRSAKGSVRTAAPVRAKERLIDVLRSCPVRDWWVEPDRSEHTSLEPPRLFSA